MLDLRLADDLQQLKRLLVQADVLVHGYRADALERLGLSQAERQRIRPGLVDICLNAYGWTGPWRLRRGFDSLVQMSNGIADARSEEHTSELQSLMRISYAVFCLKKKK